MEDVSASPPLFEDVEYGQWGLVVLSPRESAERTMSEREARAGDFRDGDIVIAEFLGDQELLIRSAPEEPESGVLVALPLDPRADWYPVAQDLADFFDRYLESGGQKYWEP